MTQKTYADSMTVNYTYNNGSRPTQKLENAPSAATVSECECFD
jgi:hypothetical protein